MNQIIYQLSPKHLKVAENNYNRIRSLSKLNSMRSTIIGRTRMEDQTTVGTLYP